MTIARFAQDPCNGYLAHLFKKVAPWAFTARLFLVVKWGFAIEIAGEKLSWTRETTRVWAADHDDWSAKVAGEGCKKPLEAGCYELDEPRPPTTYSLTCFSFRLP